MQKTILVVEKKSYSLYYSSNEESEPRKMQVGENIA